MRGFAVSSRRATRATTSTSRCRRSNEWGQNWGSSNPVRVAVGVRGISQVSREHPMLGGARNVITPIRSPHMRALALLALLLVAGQSLPAQHAGQLEIGGVGWYPRVCSPFHLGDPARRA